MARRPPRPGRAGTGGWAARPLGILLAAGLAVALLWWRGREGAGPLVGAWPRPSPNRICRLDRVLDGDSLVLDCAGQRVEVRLHCIDAPERAQVPYAKQSRRHLKSIASGELELKEIGLDRFGRTVGEVYSRGGERRMLNLEQVAAGQAAVYRRYCEDPRFIRAEQQARAAGIGIWAQPGGQQSPWTFRHDGHR